MADSKALEVLRYGVHSGVNDFTSTPGSLIFLEPLNTLDVSGLRQGKLERQTLRRDNEKNARINGMKEAGISYSLIGRGMASNDGTKPAATDCELATIFDVAFGAAGTYSADGSSATTISALNETTPSFTVGADGSDFPGGSGVMAAVGTGGTEFVAREVVSVASQVLTLDRGGWTGSTTGGTVYGAGSWYVDADNHSVTHAYHLVEGENYRRDLFGCMVSTLTLRIPGNGGYVTADLAWQACDYDDVAEANTSFSAPSAGSPIVALDSPCWIGDGGTTYADDTPFFVNELTATVTNTLQPRSTPSASNGIAGFHVVERRVTLAGSIYFGGLTGDAADGLINLMDTDGQTLDFAVQVGRGPGKTMYLRCPNVDFDAQLGSINGMNAITFTGHATRSSNHANVPGAMRVHLF